MIGIILMSLGVVGIGISTGLEIKYKEPVYAILMKIFPMIFGIGCAMYVWF